MYRFVKEYDKEKITEFVNKSELVNLFQCHPWEEVKNNWKHHFTAVLNEKDEIVASALVLKRDLPLGKCLFYIPRGPILDYSNYELLDFFLDNLKDLAKEEKAIALRFDPNLCCREYKYEDRENQGERKYLDLIEHLEAKKYKHGGFTTGTSDNTQPRFNGGTIVGENYIESLNSKTMRYLRYCELCGIKIKQGSQEIHNLAQSIKYTEQRKGVALRNEEYFQHIYDTYQDNCLCITSYFNPDEQFQEIEKLIKEAETELASDISKKRKRELENSLTRYQKVFKDLEKAKEDYPNQEILTGGALAYFNENIMEIAYMGNNPDFLHTRSSYLLYYTCLKYCQDHNIKRCSFGGIDGHLNDGLTMFKSAWDLIIEEYIGEFNLVLDPLMYFGLSKVHPFLLKLSAKLRKR